MKRYDLRSRREVEIAGMVQRRAAACSACDEFNGEICERQFRSGCCKATWLMFLTRGDCPLGRWTKET